MSKVPYTVNIDRYVCSELEEIRKMLKTNDFSQLSATVERIQHHVTAMENGLYSHKEFIYDLKRTVLEYAGEKDSNSIGFSAEIKDEEPKKAKSMEKLAKKVKKMVKKHFKD